MYCVNCGAKNSPEATSCQQCGKQLHTSDQDAPTVSTHSPTLSSPYGDTPYTTTPSPSSDPVFTPSPGVPASVLTTAPRDQRPQRRRGYFIALALIVLLVLVAVGAYVYLNRSTPEKTLTTYYGALMSGDYQTA